MEDTTRCPEKPLDAEVGLHLWLQGSQLGPPKPPKAHVGFSCTLLCTVEKRLYFGGPWFLVLKDD